MDMKVKEPVSSSSERLDSFVSSRNLRVLKRLSKGYSSEVFLTENEDRKQFALKIEKDKSPRKNMAQKEAQNLLLANSVGIGPRLFGFDPAARAVLMEFVDSIPFGKWLFEKKTSKKTLEKFVKELLAQAQKLDYIGLSHGQLAGKGKNILARNNKPVIIDFEKASTSRRCRNKNQVIGFLFRNPNSRIAEKVRECLGKKFMEKLDVFV